LIPSWNSNVDEPLDQPVYLNMLGWVKIVDIACELDSTILLKRDVSRQPLILFGPQNAIICFPVVRYPTLANLETAWFEWIDWLSFPYPFIDRILDSNYLFPEKPSFA